MTSSRNFRDETGKREKKKKPLAKRLKRKLTMHDWEVMIIH